MPLKLTDTTCDFEIALDKIEFLDENNVRYFRVSNSENIGVNFQYFPIAISNWDKERYEIYLLENSYLNAENDVFEVYEDTLTDERLGWIFPITILESNENDFRNFKNLNHYKFIAYQKLLELNINISVKDNVNEFLKLSDVFNNSIICLLCKDTIQKINDFKFDNYLLSLYKYGYLLLGNVSKSKAIYDRTEFVRQMRQNARIYLAKANFDITSNDYTRSLFQEHLLQSESHIIRFIFLYQIIEHFIQIEFDNQFQMHIDNYQNNKVAKNDLRESIINSSRERVIIKNVFNPITISQELKNEFLSECEYLFADIGLISKNSFPDKIYDIRNLVTHRLRELTTKSESLNKIIEIFELIIVDLLINYSTENANVVESADAV